MWTGVGDGVGDTPQTVMTTRAPAVLKKGKNKKSEESPHHDAEVS